MHKMFARNQGLKSRFGPDGYVNFEDWEPTKCTALVKTLAGKENPTPFVIEADTSKLLDDAFDALRGRPGWANARDPGRECRRLQHFARSIGALLAFDSYT